MLQRKLFRLLLLLLAILVVGEFSIRYLQATIPQPERSSYRNDADCSYVLKPEVHASYPQSHDHHINSLGFRDRERILPKPPGMWRLIGIGDSFVYGDVPIDRNFLRILDDSLHVVPPDGYADMEVVIAGIPGWDARNAVGLMRGKGPALNPDVALLCFSIGSDVTGIPIPGAVFQGNLFFTGSRSPVLNLLRKSRLFVLAEQLYGVRAVNKLRKWRDNFQFAAGDAALPDNAAVHAAEAPEEFHGVNAMRYPGSRRDLADPGRRIPMSPQNLRRQVENLPLYQRETPPEIARLWEQAEKQLLEFEAACRACGAHGVLLIAPAEIQVDPIVRELTMRRAPLPAGAYDFDLPTRRLRDFSTAHGLSWIDLLPALKRAQAESGLRQYVPNNGHWNVPGNAVVAGELAASPLIVSRHSPERTGGLTASGSGAADRVPDVKTLD
jgi:hypothetical protein